MQGSSPGDPFAQRADRRYVGHFAQKTSPERPRLRFAMPYTGAGRIVITCGFVLGALCATSGCGRQAEISRYQVPHEDSAAVVLPGDTLGSAATGSSMAPAAGQVTDQRMLALIIPVGNQAWFVKAMGPTEKVAAIESDFGVFRDSLRFESETSPPTWTLPAGWTQSPGNQFRYATIDAAGVDLSVSSLPMTAAQPTDEYFLSNVNRWRGQLQLAPLTVSELVANTQPVTLGGHSGIAVDLVGKGSAGGPPMMSGGTASGVPPTLDAGSPAKSTSPTGASPPSTPSGPNRDLGFDVPEGWQPGRSGPFRLAAFDIQRDGASAEVTLSALGPNAGSLLDNVNRWRGQIQLPPIDDAALQSAITPIQVAGIDSQWIELSESGGDDTAPSQAILVVVVPQTTQTLFIKMLGERALVINEKDHFRSFAESLRLPTAPTN